jgi:hypothetical protein
MCTKTLGYGLDGPESESRQWKDFFFFSKTSRQPPGPTGPQWVTGYITGRNAAEGKFNHSTQSSTEITREWSYAFTPPIRQHGVDRDSFTLTF